MKGVLVGPFSLLEFDGLMVLRSLKWIKKTFFKLIKIDTFI